MLTTLTLAIALVLDGIAGQPPHMPWYTAMTEASHLRLAGKYAAAEARYREAVREASKEEPAVASHLGASLNDLAMVCAAEGKYREAETLYLRSIAVWEVAQETINLAVAFSNLAGTYSALNQPGRAEAYYRKALELLPGDSAELASPMNNLAALLMRTSSGPESLVEAEELLHHSIAIYKQWDVADASSTGPLLNLGELERRRGNAAQAEALARQALTILEARLPAGHPNIAAAVNNLGAAISAQGRYSEAEPLLKRALDMRVAALGPGHPRVADTLAAYAILLRAAHRNKEAKKIEARAMAIASSDARENQNDAMVEWKALSKAYSAR
jgi:tetratricopeptide (TPR) repeat protein